MSKVTTPEQEIKELKEEVKLFKHRYKESEVWLKCFTAVIASGDTANAEFIADTLAKEYWSRFE